MTFKKQDFMYRAKKKKNLPKPMAEHKVNVRDVFSLEKSLTCFFSIVSVINRFLMKKNNKGDQFYC